MKLHVNEYLQTLNARGVEKVGYILEETKLEKAQTDFIVQKLSNQGIFASLVMPEEAERSLISAASVGGAVRDASTRLNEIYQSSNLLSLLLDSNVSILTADIKALEDELVALEKSVDNYAFLLSDNGAYDYAHIEPFSDNRNRENSFEFLIPDRNDTTFSIYENATVHSNEGVLSIPSVLTRTHPLRAMVLNANCRSFITSDTGIGNSVNNRPDKGWRVAVSAPTIITSTLPEFRNLHSPTEYPGANFTLEFTLPTAEPCDSIAIDPFADTPFEIVQIIAYPEFTDNSPKKLLDNPIVLTAATNIYFPLQPVAKFKVFLRQSTYKRNNISALLSEVEYRNVQESTSSAPTPSNLPLPRDARYSSLLRHRLQAEVIFNTTVYNVAIPRSTYRDIKYGNLDLTPALFNPLVELSDRTWSRISRESVKIESLIQERFNDSEIGLLIPVTSGKTNIRNQNQPYVPGLGSVTTSTNPADRPGSVFSEVQKYEYNLGIRSVKIGVGARVFRGVFVSKQIPSPGDVGEVKIKVNETNYQETNAFKQGTVVTSIEYSVTNQSHPSSEEDWAPILPTGQESVVAERLLPDEMGNARLRFSASLERITKIYKNGYELEIPLDELIVRTIDRQSILGFKFPIGFVGPQDILTVDYVPADNATIVNFEKAGYEQPPLVSSSDNDGAGEWFGGTSGQLIVDLANEPFVDYPRVDISTYNTITGLGPYNPVLVRFDDGTVAVNLTNYKGGSQTPLNSASTTYQFIHTQKSLMFNKLVDKPFRVYYQYLPSNLRFRAVLRCNFHEFVSPKLDFIQIKAKTRKADARKTT